MRKRIVAALIAASTICWSIVPAASSIALGWPSRPAATKAASSHQHDCCPRSYRTMVPVLAAMNPPAMPCGNQHPCCMQQAPDRSPALTVAKTDPRPKSTTLSVVVATVTFRSAFTASDDTRLEAASDSVLRSTVVRI